ncbi:hypothetical protein BJ165DRAFT_175273 [Panaeolus papilionaceus]|nr:hypothetical protein BJ165DRAFT_175273 [Panaeolus papilionaceus]
MQGGMKEFIRYDTATALTPPLSPPHPPAISLESWSTTASTTSTRIDIASISRSLSNSPMDNNMKVLFLDSRLFRVVLMATTLLAIGTTPRLIIMNTPRSLDVQLDFSTRCTACDDRRRLLPGLGHTHLTTSISTHSGHDVLRIAFRSFVFFLFGLANHVFGGYFLLCPRIG